MTAGIMLEELCVLFEELAANRSHEHTSERKRKAELSYGVKIILIKEFKISYCK